MPNHPNTSQYVESVTRCCLPKQEIVRLWVIGTSAATLASRSPSCRRSLPALKACTGSGFANICRVVVDSQLVTLGSFRLEVRHLWSLNQSLPENRIPKIRWFAFFPHQICHFGKSNIFCTDPYEYADKCPYYISIYIYNHIYAYIILWLLKL